MTGEVKLLTAHDVSLLRARAVDQTSANQIEAFLRERGLIAPEPDAIDRLRDALEAIHGITLDRDKMARVCREARMELRPQITREMVRVAAVSAGLGRLLTGHEVTRLHAALTDAKGGE